MATRHVTYQFDWGFATYDHNTEQDAIDAIEAKGEYINKFPVTIAERELIDDSDTEVVVENDSLILRTESGEVII